MSEIRKLGEKVYVKATGHKGIVTGINWNRERVEVAFPDMKSSTMRFSEVGGVKPARK